MLIFGLDLLSFIFFVHVCYYDINYFTYLEKFYVNFVNIDESQQNSRTYLKIDWGKILGKRLLRRGFMHSLDHLSIPYQPFHHYILSHHIEPIFLYFSLLKFLPCSHEIIPTIFKFKCFILHFEEDYVDTSSLIKEH